MNQKMLLELCVASDIAKEVEKFDTTIIKSLACMLVDIIADKESTTIENIYKELLMLGQDVRETEGVFKCPTRHTT